MAKKDNLYHRICSPARFYLILSFVALLLITIQNVYNPGKLCLGSYSCTYDSTPAFLLGNAVYILFCTWILDLICKGSPTLSWIVVLLPFIAMFILFSLILFTGIRNDKKNGKIDSNANIGTPYTTKALNGPSNTCLTCGNNTSEGFDFCFKCGYKAGPGYGSPTQVTVGYGAWWPPSAW